MLKSTTVDRYKQWKEHASSSDKFTWEGKGYTKEEFDALHFGGSQEKTPETINTDIEEKHEDLEQSLETGDTSID